MKTVLAIRFCVPSFVAVIIWMLSLFDSPAISAEGEAIKIRVTNHSTHAPITGAKISVREDNQAFKEIGVTSDGNLLFNAATAGGKMEFHVEAKGYDDRTMFVSAEKGVAEIDLYPSKFQVTGIVVAADGQAVPEAQVAFGIGKLQAALIANRRLGPGKTEPLRLQSANSFKNAAVTEKDGSFGAMARPEATAIVALHQLGCGGVSMTNWT